MQKEIERNGQTITYTVRISKRAKRVRLTIYSTGLTVTIPKLSALPRAEKFIQEKGAWVISKLKSKANSPTPLSTAGSYKTHKNIALQIVKERLEHFNAIYNFEYKKITIRNQKTRWGSCSRKGNLNFSYKIALIPPKLADYIIVHELCHIKEFNHSKNFWELVAQTVPNYMECRKRLKALT